MTFNMLTTMVIYHLLHFGHCRGLSRSYSPYLMPMGRASSGLCRARSNASCSSKCKTRFSRCASPPSSMAFSMSWGRSLSEVLSDAIIMSRARQKKRVQKKVNLRNSKASAVVRGRVAGLNRTTHNRQLIISYNAASENPEPQCIQALLHSLFSGFSTLSLGRILVPAR